MKFIGLEKELYAPVKRAIKHLGIEKEVSRMTLCFKAGERPTLTYTAHLNCATVEYGARVHIFRALGHLAYAVKNDMERYLVGDTQNFDTVGVMPDLSFGAPMTVKAICEYLDYMAVMGLNMLLLYIEDLYELPSRPCFGHQRGRYTPEELRAIDDYAYEYGIEVVPCIQTLGHLDKYLHWSEAEDVRDPGAFRELSVDKEASYGFIREMITESTKCFRSKRVHIGMDEAWGLGRCMRTLNQYGLRDQQELFVNHLNRVVSITDELGLRPIIWNDFVFCLNSSTGVSKYRPDTVIPKEIKDRFPKNVDLVYWHYGEESQDCDDHMLKKNLEFGNNVMFCGGLLMWTAPLPDNQFSYMTTELGLKAAKENGIKEVFTALWCYGKNGCDMNTTLLHIQQYAEHAYSSATKERIKKRFEACTGASYDAFMNMSLFHNKMDREYPNYSERFHGQKFFWQDILLGKFDCFLENEPMSDHYAAAKELYRPLIGKDKWSPLYKRCFAILDLLETKTYIAENLAKEYKAGNKKFLEQCMQTELPKLEKKIDVLHELYRKMWFSSRKPYGFEELDTRLAALKARCISARLRLKDYLRGKIDEIEELRDVRMPMPESYSSQ